MSGGGFIPPLSPHPPLLSSKYDYHWLLKKQATWWRPNFKLQNNSSQTSGWRHRASIHYLLYSLGLDYSNALLTWFSLRLDVNLENAAAHLLGKKKLQSHITVLTMDHFYMSMDWVQIGFSVRIQGSHVLQSQKFISVMLSHSTQHQHGEFVCSFWLIWKHTTFKDFILCTFKAFIKVVAKQLLEIV